MGKILFIGWDYQNYTHEIVAELGQQGFSVTYYPLHPYSLPTKIRRLVSPQWATDVETKQQRVMVEKEKGNRYDIVFCLLPFLKIENLAILKEQQREATFILYIWDAVSGYTRKGIDMQRYFGFFDKVYTFDMIDARQYHIDYLPLFCVKQYIDMVSSHDCNDNVYMVGNLADLRRYDAVKQFELYCIKHDIHFDFFLKSTITKNLKILRKGGSLRNLYLSSISNDKLSDMIRNSAAVFDFANHVQNGFTMRLMENLCAGKKIITNNKNVLEAPFYSPDRFFVYDNLDFDGVKEFLQIPLAEPNQRFEEYHLSSFVKKIIS